MFLCGVASGYSYAEGSIKDIIAFTLLALISSIAVIFIVTTGTKVIDNPTPYCSVCEQYYEDDFVYCPIDGIELEKK